MRTIGNTPVDGELRAVATGELPDGKTVFVNADGTVSLVGSANISTPVSYPNSTEQEQVATYNSAVNRVIIAYVGSFGGANRATAIVGTVSGGTITFGTPLVFDSYSATSYDLGITYVGGATGKVVIAFKVGGNSKAIAGNVYDSTISFGTAVNFTSNTTLGALDIFWQTNSSQVVISYRDSTNSDQGTSVVGTVSGTSITYGTPVVFQGFYTINITGTYMSAGNRILLACYNGNNAAGTCYVGSVGGAGGNTLSFLGSSNFTSQSPYYIAVGYNPTLDKAVIVYREQQNANSLAKVVSVAPGGYNPTFGTAVSFNSGSIGERMAATFDTVTDKLVISYRDVGNSNYPTLVVATLNGTAISFGTPVVITQNESDDLTSTFDSNSNKVVIAYHNQVSPASTQVVIFDAGSSNILTEDNYIGISKGYAANGTVAVVQTANSINKTQIGLTAGQDYFVQNDGSLSETPATPSVFAGTAVSATKIIVKG